MKSLLYKSLFLLLAYVLSVSATAPSAYAMRSLLGLPSVEELENPNPELASLVYSEDGVLIHKYFNKNRTFVPLRSIPRSTRYALIATEDAEFYNHWGVNVRRVFVAMGENLFRAPKRWHGASTITQQLAKNLYLTQERTFSRKFKELITAIELERTYTKDEILALYFNTVYFGAGAYGIESAAQTYFGKSASQLTLPESATLIATLKNPTAYNPAKNPAGSISRRNLILGLMEKNKFITPQQAAKAKRTPLTLKYTPLNQQGLAPYFAEYIRQTIKPATILGDLNLYRDGLTVRTTLDSRMQKYAQQAAVEHLASLQAAFDRSWRWPENLKNQIIRESERYKELVGSGMSDGQAMARLKADNVWLHNILREKTRIQVALVAIDPNNGHVKAWVGGNSLSPDEYKYQFDHVWQARRQPGSTFKPFVYTAAIDKGLPANFQVLDQPLQLSSGDGIWSPRNSDGSSGGMTTLRSALTRSLNQVTVRLAYEHLSPAEIISYAKRMGINSPMPNDLSIALGTAAVSPLELAGAFTPFANNGIWSEPISILKVEDKHKRFITSQKPNSRFAIDSTTNYVMVSMLRDVINRGTGASVRSYGFTAEAAGKTGTTQNMKDAWFAGFTPQLVAVVWTGFDDERIKFTSMEYGQGARAALPIWAKFMQRCYSDPTLKLGSRYFHIPETVIAVPTSSAQNNMAADLLGGNVSFEYFTPKGFEYYQSHPELAISSPPPMAPIDSSSNGVSAVTMPALKPVAPVPSAAKPKVEKPH